MVRCHPARLWLASLQIAWPLIGQQVTDWQAAKVRRRWEAEFAILCSSLLLSWNVEICAFPSHTLSFRGFSLSYGECFDFIINLPKRNRRQYGTFVVKYKFGSNYPVAGFLRPDVDNNVSATEGWAARGALCASPPTRVIPCALRGPGWEGRGKTKVGRNIWTFLSAKGSIYKSKLMFA